MREVCFCEETHFSFLYTSLPRLRPATLPGFAAIDLHKTT